MKGILKKTCAVFMSAAIAVTMASCGAQFNTVGATVGNMLNGGEVTSQHGSTYYLKDGDIYKTDSVSKEGKVIITVTEINTNKEAKCNVTIKPVEVKSVSSEEQLSQILYIGAGLNHALVVDSNGYVEVWGSNAQKQLASFSISKSVRPIYINPSF